MDKLIIINILMMLFTLDNFILLSFLTYLLITSYLDIGKSKNINTYAVGQRSFTTFALGATITATFVSGSGFIMDLENFYKQGWEYLLPSLGMVLGFVLFAIFIVPKMGRFLGKTSIATIMYEEYGQTTRVITAILGFTAVCGTISIQFKILGRVGNIFYEGWSWQTWSIILGCITTFYTVIGGIRSVVHTDIIQSICFVISISFAICLFYFKIPIITYDSFSDANKFHFNIMSIFSLQGDNLRDMLLLGAYFLIPGMSPTTIQRVSMGFNTWQVTKSYLYSSIFILFIMLVSCGISYLAFEANEGRAVDNVLKYFINQFIIPGSKAIVIIGIISMCMSTADSYINIASVLLANDTINSLTWNNADKLYFARWFGIGVGIVAVFLSLFEKDLLSSVLLFRSFYMPVITVPVLALVFGYKTTTKCCLFTMSVSFLYVLIFKFILNPDFNIIPYGVLLNAIVLISSHYVVEKWELLKCFGIRSQLKTK